MKNDFSIATREELERGLREEAGLVGPPPPGLHQGIMERVREESLSSGRRPVNVSREAEVPGDVSWVEGWLRWLPAPALGVSVALAFMVSRPAQSPGSSPDPLPVAAGWLVKGAELPAAPASLVSPMAREYDRLDRDLRRTAAFLISSIP